MNTVHVSLFESPLDHIALTAGGGLYPFQNKSSSSMPVIPQVHLIMFVFLWLVTNMDAEINI